MLPDDIEQPQQLVGCAADNVYMPDRLPAYFTTRKDSAVTVYNLWGHDWNNRRYDIVSTIVTDNLSQGLEKVKLASTY